MPKVIQTVLTPGFIAALAFFLFTVLGFILQVIKLHQRSGAASRGKIAPEGVCAGLHPVREFISFLAFLLFALSGLTRSYLDSVLVFSRLPVVILSTVILWYLARYSDGKSRKLLFSAVAGDLLFLALLIFVLTGHSVSHTAFPILVDWSLAGISFLLFYGKLLQAFTMYKDKKSAAVSWGRELGLTIKDLTGLCYAVSIGNELRWVALTHILSFFSSSAICGVKYVLERNSGDK